MMAEDRWNVALDKAVEQHEQRMKGWFDHLYAKNLDFKENIDRAIEVEGFLAGAGVRLAARLPDTIEQVLLQWVFNRFSDAHSAVTELCRHDEGGVK